MKKVLALILALVMALALVACGDKKTEDPKKEDEPQKQEETSKYPKKKVAFIANSSFADGGWNAEGYATVNELAKTYGYELSCKENVGDADVADCYRNYAAEGYDIIIDNEQYHCETMKEIAPEFPNVTFVCCNGYVTEKNMISITSGMWQNIYLSGVAAASATKSGKIGIITFSTTSDSATTMKAAYTAGAKSIKADIEVVHVATGSFSDLQKGKEMAQSLIDQGVDVIICNSGDCNSVVTQLCIDKKIYAVSAITNRNAMDANYVLGSSLLQDSVVITRALESIYAGDGKYLNQVYTGGIFDGLEAFIINDGVKTSMPDLVKNVEAAQKDIIDGKIEKPIPEKTVG